MLLGLILIRNELLCPEKKLEYSSTMLEKHPLSDQLIISCLNTLFDGSFLSVSFKNSESQNQKISFVLQTLLRVVLCRHGVRIDAFSNHAGALAVHEIHH